MILLLQRYAGPFGVEARILPHVVNVRGRQWLAVLRVGPWSLVLTRSPR